MSDMNTVRISVRLPKRLRSEILKRAKATRRKEAELIREALEKEFQAPPQAQSCFDLASELGLVGLVKNAPTDLSTNVNHMEGFGSIEK